MPRYLIERSFPEGLSIPMNDAAARPWPGSWPTTPSSV